MSKSIADVFQEQGRGVVGALVVSVELLYTMETWWLGWQLPAQWLFAYAVVGLVAVMLLTRSVGFRKAEERRDALRLRVLAVDFSQLLFQSFLTAYAVLLLVGIIDLRTPLGVVARLGLTYVVPLGFGAALANVIFRGAEDEGDELERPFYRHLATLAVGALFVSITPGPTDEMELMAAYAGWVRLAALVVLSVLVSYLILFELEFRGQRQRIRDRGLLDQLGHACIAYAVGFVVSVGLLASFGHFGSTPVAVWVQEAIVLSFPSTVGASGVRVVLA